MKDANKTKAQLVKELSAMRRLEQYLKDQTSQLKQSEERYRRLIEASPVSIMALRNGCFLFVNPAGTRMLGFTNPDDLIGRVAMDFVAPESQQEVVERIKRLDEGIGNPIVELKLIKKDGKRITVESTSVSIPIEGIPTAVIIAQDITKRKNLDLELKDSEERFQAFMENNPASIYIKDENDVHIYANPAALESTGFKHDELIGSTSRDVWPPEIADKLIKLDRKVLKDDIPKITEEWSNAKDGSTIWRKDLKFPIKLTSGKKLLGGIAIDITEIKQSEQNLQHAYNEIKHLKQKLEQENIYLREEIEVNHKHKEIIGNSKPVLEMLGRVEQVAETDSTVLILGETGTGKELLARAIHESSLRKDHQMIKVNCAALPSALIESELFGREKGAFTGAMTRQIGRFEIADGATLFLDEIGELPLEVQAKLLRVLQEGHFERLGSPRTISVDVRIIASTNRDLAKTVAEGRFRQDLYYRLNVFSITAPPLRDRIEDIPLLVWALVKELETSMGKPIEKISQKEIDALKQYAWPGNIRELRNTVENSMIINKGKTLKLIPPVIPSYNAPKSLELEVVERNHITDVLKKTSWRVSGDKGAAKLLGLKPTTLEARMKKLGIERPH